jgi:hypothetical protein
MPKRPDEVALWNAFGTGAEHETVRAAAAALDIPAGRVYYLCCKWAEKGIYEWGSFADLGWKWEDKGMPPFGGVR